MTDTTALLDDAPDTKPRAQSSLSDQTETDLALEAFDDQLRRFTEASAAERQRLRQSVLDRLRHAEAPFNYVLHVIGAFCESSRSGRLDDAIDLIGQMQEDTVLSFVLTHWAHLRSDDERFVVVKAASRALPPMMRHSLWDVWLLSKEVSTREAVVDALGDCLEDREARVLLERVERRDRSAFIRRLAQECLSSEARGT